MKKLLVGIAALLVIAGLAAMLLWSNLDELVARMIERVGTETLGTAVHVGGVSIDLAEGLGTIRKVSVANPEGFSGATAFTLGEIRLDLDLDAIGGDGPIILDEVSVDAPVVNLEIDASGRVNLDAIRKSAEKASEASEERALEEADDARKIRIDQLGFAAGKVVADSRAVGGDLQEVELPAVSLREVGGHGGTSPGRIAQALVGALLGKAVAVTATQELEGLVKRELEQRLEEEDAESLGDALGGKARELLGGDGE